MGMKYVEDGFEGLKFKQEILTGIISKEPNGTVKFATASNDTETHFKNYFSFNSNDEPIKVVMVENYKSPKITDFTATDVFLSQYAAASPNSSKTFPDSLPNKLPQTIVRDTVDGTAARTAVFKIFGGENMGDVIDDDGKERTIPDDQKKITLARGTLGFDKAMDTVNGKSTGHIVSDFNTLKNTNHVIESIDITRTHWLSGIKMNINISEG